ncbi:MAG: hypothetical protein LBT47_00645 [Deltaproteobacteria bacterium]|nr:hypothetical protein [Deltaproteobacteria bacterium]
MEIGSLLNEPADPSACHRFILSQLQALPGWLKPAFVMLGWAAQLSSLILKGSLFTRLDAPQRARTVIFFNRLPGPTRQFMRFHRVLTAFFCFEGLKAPVSQ